MGYDTVTLRVLAEHRERVRELIEEHEYCGIGIDRVLEGPDVERSPTPDVSWTLVPLAEFEAEAGSHEAFTHVRSFLLEESIPWSWHYDTDDEDVLSLNTHLRFDERGAEITLELDETDLSMPLDAIEACLEAPTLREKVDLIERELRLRLADATPLPWSSQARNARVHRGKKLIRGADDSPNYFDIPF